MTNINNIPSPEENIPFQFDQRLKDAQERFNSADFETSAVVYQQLWTEMYHSHGIYRANMLSEEFLRRKVGFDLPPYMIEAGQNYVDSMIFRGYWSSEMMNQVVRVLGTNKVEPYSFLYPDEALNPNWRYNQPYINATIAARRIHESRDAYNAAIKSRPVDHKTAAEMAKLQLVTMGGGYPESAQFQYQWELAYLTALYKDIKNNPDDYDNTRVVMIAKYASNLRDKYQEYNNIEAELKFRDFMTGLTKVLVKRKKTN